MAAHNIDTRIQFIFDDFMASLDRRSAAVDGRLAARDRKLDDIDNRLTTRIKWLGGMTATIPAMVAILVAYVTIGMFRGVGGSSVFASQSAAVVSESPAPAAAGGSLVASESPEAADQ